MLIAVTELCSQESCQMSNLEAWNLRFFLDQGAGACPSRALSSSGHFPAPRAEHFPRTTQVLPCVIWMSSKSDLNSHGFHHGPSNLYVHLRWDHHHFPGDCHAETQVLASEDRCRFEKPNPWPGFSAGVKDLGFTAWQRLVLAHTSFDSECK